MSIPTVIPDPYGECENALKAYIQELTTFFPNDWQVSNDDTVIARGGDHFVILRPGAFPTFSSHNTGMQKDIDWEVVVDVYVRYAEYEASWADFKQLRAALLWALNTNPILACTVQPEKSAKNVWYVNLYSNEETQYFRFDDNENQRPNFIIQTMGVTIRQRVEFPF